MKSIISNLQWSKRFYTLSTLVEEFGNQLPVIVQITKGFCGQNDIDVVSSGEVSLMLSIQTQRRMFVMDYYSRIYSIPYEGLKVHLVAKNGRRKGMMPVEDVIKKKPLPLIIDLESQKNLDILRDNTAVNFSKLGPLILFHVYTETFVLLCTISQDNNCKMSTMVPIYVDIQLTVASGKGRMTNTEITSLLNRCKATTNTEERKLTNDISKILLLDGITHPLLPRDSFFEASINSLVPFLQHAFCYSKRNSLLFKKSSLRIGSYRRQAISHRHVKPRTSVTTIFPRDVNDLSSIQLTTKHQRHQSQLVSRSESTTGVAAPYRLQPTGSIATNISVDPTSSASTSVTLSNGNGNRSKHSNFNNNELQRATTARVVTGDTRKRISFSDDHTEIIFPSSKTQTTTRRRKEAVRPFQEKEITAQVPAQRAFAGSSQTASAIQTRDIGTSAHEMNEVGGKTHRNKNDKQRHVSYSEQDTVIHLESETDDNAPIKKTQGILKNSENNRNYFNYGNQLSSSSYAYGDATNNEHGMLSSRLHELNDIQEKPREERFSTYYDTVVNDFNNLGRDELITRSTSARPIIDYDTNHNYFRATNNKLFGQTVLTVEDPAVVKSRQMLNMENRNRFPAQIEMPTVVAFNSVFQTERPFRSQRATTEARPLMMSDVRDRNEELAFGANQRQKFTKSIGVVSPNLHTAPIKSVDKDAGVEESKPDTAVNVTRKLLANNT